MNTTHSGAESLLAVFDVLASGDVADVLLAMQVCKSWRRIGQSHAGFRKLHWLSLYRRVTRSEWSLQSFTAMLDGWWGRRLRCFDAVQGDEGSREALTDALLVLILSRAPLITAVMMHHCHHISDASLGALALMAPPLHVLDLGWSARVTAWGLKQVIDRCGGTLTTLCVSSTSNTLSLLTVDDGVAHQLCMLCPLLTTLHMNDTSIGNLGLAAISIKMPHLQCLGLDGSHAWDEQGMACLAVGCQGLISFSAAASRLADMDLCRLLASCRAVEAVRVSNCSAITLKGIQECADVASDSLLLLEFQGVGGAASPTARAAFSSWARSSRWELSPKGDALASPGASPSWVYFGDLGRKSRVLEEACSRHSSDICSSVGSPPPSLAPAATGD